jgi:hypothetical protein
LQRKAHRDVGDKVEAHTSEEELGVTVPRHGQIKTNPDRTRSKG